MPDFDFIQHIVDLMSPMDVFPKKMFGGYGIFCGEVMIGLVADDVLFLKTDEQNKQDYIDEGLGPFVYSKKGKDVMMSFWEAPVGCLENGDEMREWAEKAYEAALRSKKPKKKKKSD